ncbi:MAG: hypothetical protein FJ395_07965 [Verrucomicrobia bacterium]|nr:hypothetical protein [Verrucomicrobiota bacterium]
MVQISKSKCVCCHRCALFCPVAAIRSGRDGASWIDEAICVECGVCVRNGCLSGAIRRRRSPWPRSVRALFSDPVTKHRSTGVPGRGTAESKTNDVTNRIQPGQVGLNVELGRPGVGTSFHQVQQVTRRMAKAGAGFEEQNPLTHLMSDRRRGVFPRELWPERVLSVVVEASLPLEELAGVLKELRAVERKIGTVFSVSVYCRWADRRRMLALVDRRRLLPQAKVNVGLGRARRQR